jgi:integrase
MASIRKHGKKWRAEVYKHGTRRSKVLATKAQAMAWAVDVERELEAGGDIPDKTFGELLEKYRDEVSESKKGYRWEAARIGLLLRDPIADVRLPQLAQPDCAAWRDRRLREVSPASVRREWTLMSHACTVAIREWHWLRENPFTGVKRPANPPPRDRRITQDEIDRILLACGYDEPPTTAQARVGAAFLFALETAMRAGEIAALTWANVHERHVHLPRTKNGNKRDVPLSVEARRIIDLMGDSDPVFGLTADQISGLFRKARDRAMIEDLHFHDSRREALTRLSKRLDVMQLAKVSGHRDLRILQAVYYAPTVDDLVDQLRGTDD